MTEASVWIMVTPEDDFTVNPLPVGTKVQFGHRQWDNPDNIDWDETDLGEITEAAIIHGQNPDNHPEGEFMTHPLTILWVHWSGGSWKPEGYVAWIAHDSETAVRYKFPFFEYQASQEGNKESDI